MTERVQRGVLKVSKELDAFLRNEVLEDLDITEDQFWGSFQLIVEEFFPKNKNLLNKREEFQKTIDEWHLNDSNKPFNQEAYNQFLKDIGYWLEEGENFQINTSEVDPEISTIAGAQLVVPVTNARFSLNAANARWGSLYDALYGTDVISEEGGSERTGPYNLARGEKVIGFAKTFLDQAIPLKDGSYDKVTGFSVSDENLEFTLSDQSQTSLSNSVQFVGYKGPSDNPHKILFKNNNLHIEIQVDREDSVGKDDPAGVKDIFLESAITTIQDCEDSVAAVDAEDKITVYRNWLGLMRGSLKETFLKGESEITRELEPDREYISPLGEIFNLPGRSLMLVRNVGHLMTNPAVLDKDNNEIPEGILDAMFTICIAKYDLDSKSKLTNSREGSVYIVKPKMHGPEEVKFTCDLFSSIEKALNIKPLSVKVGIMDEERRTTINLKECIREAKDRVIFINTGFLDRTGDEIHTSMEAGPMIPKAEMKEQPWIEAYEDWNVDNGLETGFKGKAQIGKGMWAMPDEMLAMYETKLGHPKAGANCAWVPSPTAATIHALHYHQVSVEEQQDKILSRPKANIEDILKIPVMPENVSLTQEQIQAELDNNAQGILGYVVRWVDQGVGCSKVPDINNVGLMEDRATCRISSQHMANWLHHGLCTKEQIIETMKRMALVVDEQNEDDPDYKPMSLDYQGHAFSAACSLVLKGRMQPSGYTEPILHAERLKYKGK